MSASQHLLLEIDERECRRLLGTASGIGRLGFTERALPMILPVHFTVRAGEIVVASISDSKTATARRGTVVAFELDDYDPATREGWTVNVIGPTRLITDPAEIDALDALDFAPWTGNPHRTYFTVQVAMVQGRRLISSAGRATPDMDWAATALASEA